MLETTNACHPLDDDATVCATNSQDDAPMSGRYSSSEPMTQVEILCIHERRSRKQGRISSLKAGSNSPAPKKSLRFATIAENNQVWGFVKECPEIPVFLKADLWWTKVELESCNDDKLELLAGYENLYKSTLRAAFLSCKDEKTDEGTVALCFLSMLTCSSVRGLEAKVVPQLRHYKKKHRRAVLAAIEACAKKVKSRSIDQEREFVRERSLLFSRPCRLV
jgi:hypothetical protein